MKSIRIATRQSTLALWQANYVRDKILSHYPDCNIELLPFKTQGDIILDTPLAKIGGKGLFVKELQTAMLENKADIAVHSLKDVPMDLPQGLQLSCICERHSPFDALISNTYPNLNALPHNATLGTSSLRRQAQIQHIRPDLTIKTLRGNINTRLAKLDNNEYDAIILAEAGLQRLGMQHRITETLNSQQCLPAVGQGVMAIESRTDNDMVEFLQPLHCKATAYRVKAERAMNKQLQGGCQVPIAGYATIDNKILILEALVSNTDGSHIIKTRQQAVTAQSEALGIQAAEILLQQGAAKLLAELGIEL